MKRLFLLPLLVLAVSCYPGETDQTIHDFEYGHIPDDPGDGVTKELTATVTTGAASDIAITSAKISGSWSGANAVVREAGFLLGTSAEDLEETWQAELPGGGTGTTGAFSVSLNALDGGVTYYYCAYV